MRYCIVVVGALLIGCATNSASLTKVNIGMTRTQVIQILGQPQSASSDSQNEYLIFELRDRMSRIEEPWPLHQITEHYYVAFRNGLVESYGKTDEQQAPQVGYQPFSSASSDAAASRQRIEDQQMDLQRQAQQHLNQVNAPGSSPYRPVYVAPTSGVGGN